MGCWLVNGMCACAYVGGGGAAVCTCGGGDWGVAWLMRGGDVGGWSEKEGG